MNKKIKCDSLEDHVKMDILRSVAKKIPNGNVSHILKTIDKEWDIQIDKIRKKMRQYN